MKIGRFAQIAIVLFGFSAVATIGYFLLLPKFNLNDSQSGVADSSFGWKFPVAKFPITGSGNGDIAYSTIRDPGGIPQGLPVRLQIPVISVDSAIEDALITPDGRMDVPAGSVNVAWFALGPHPGRVGSAVIGGHFGIQNGVPFVFYNLDKVKVGDKVYIIDDKNNTLTFQVRNIKSFDRNGDSTTVFTSGDGIAHLNLITCEGVWNQVNGTYPQRLVVFTDLIPTVAATPAAPRLPTTAITPVPAMASPVPPTPTQTPALPVEIVVQVPVSAFQSLYATPVDSVVTSFLLISIIFVFIKIIRR